MGMLDVAMRRPVTIVVAVVAVAFCAVMALMRMRVDIFPNLNLPVIYVVQPYGGMLPPQMEGYLVDWYEDHFFYIDGIKEVESKSIESVSMIKLTFHPGTDMAAAMANTVAQVERSKAFMPPGTVGPFVLRFGAGSVPAGYLVISSDKRNVNELQDITVTRVRPLFAALPGVSGAPAFGGNQRTIVVTVDPDRLRAYQMSADEVIKALATGNAIVPAGDVRTGKLDRFTPMNATVSLYDDLKMLPIRKGAGPTVFLRDLGEIKDDADVATGYALVNGRRTVYLPVVKLSSASTLSVVNEVKNALPTLRYNVPADVSIKFEFDQSVYVTDAINNVATEGIHGALLTGLMVLLFLRDVRSALIVLTSIPAAILTAIVGLDLAGQTINIMTLSGLALAIGILVDEATVTIENIHSHLSRGEALPISVLRAGQETVTPRFLAMMSVISVFVPSFFMEGATKSLFVPLSLAVGFSMMASYVLSSTLVPVISTWFLKPGHHAKADPKKKGFFDRVKSAYTALLLALLRARYAVFGVYLIGSLLIAGVIYPQLASQIFPDVDTGQFQVKLKAPTGTRFEETYKYALKLLEVIKQVAGGPQNVMISIGYVGTQPPAYALSNIYVFTSGPHEGVLTVALKPGAIPLPVFKDRLRKAVHEQMPDAQISFEPGDIVSKIMNFGAPTPIEVAVTGLDLDNDRVYAEKVLAEMKKVKMLRDVQIEQPLDYPTMAIDIDREMAGQLGVSVKEVGDSLVAASSSSRWISQNYWTDPKTGVSYQVQVEMPQWHIGSIKDVEAVPAMPTGKQGPFVRDLAKLSYGTMPGEIDHVNQQRLISISANIEGSDMGRAAREVDAAIARAGKPPRGVFVAQRGQVPTMKETFFGLQVGVGLAIIVILMMLTANFQSLPLAMVIVSIAPAIIAGEVIALMLTGTTLNVQSFMGGIMAIGVGVSNSILLITFAENNRLKGGSSLRAAMSAGRERLRPVLMTSIAMISGMVPMAISAEAQASLARAVIGGLLVSTPCVLLIMPLIFSIARARSSRTSASIHPEDSSVTAEVH
ncbi:MAG: efflux RND transporter permease subunit [Candidatus Obscuribacterales bacterium]|nr:efflux RND transporter permease subunit [Candidatus Obscuribacterales bacterium]